MRPLQSSTGATAGLEVSEHMKTRVLSAAALLPLLLVIVLVLPAWATAVLFGAAAAIAAYELLYRTGMVKNLRLVIYAMVMAVLVSFWSLRPDSNLAHLGVLAYFALLLGETLLSHGRLRFEKVCLCLAAGLLLPYLLTALVRIRAMYAGADPGQNDLGKYYILVAFVIAFTTANRVPHYSEKAILPVGMLHDDAINPLFRAVAECVEESVLSSLLHAETVTGYHGRTVQCLSDLLKK